MKHFILLATSFLLVLGAPKVAQGLELVPGGENIVFEIKTDGVIVTGTYDVENGKGIYNPSKHSDIVKGDIIKQIEEYKVTSLSSFVEHFNEFLQQKEVKIVIERKGKREQKTLHLIEKGDAIRTGLYVKERLIGIGTVSFYDPVNKLYGALGHEVYDSDSSTIVDVRTGTIYKGDVIGITKGENGHVGEKVSETTLDDPLGTVVANTSFGIFGSIEEIPTTYTPIEMAKHDEVKLGDAKILTCVKGQEVKEFAIRITSLKKQDSVDIKGISFTITDQKLLSLSGGIYYGMSGSPIIQDNKLVGAVTHVLSDDIASGYGIYMEYMLQKAIEAVHS